MDGVFDAIVGAMRTHSDVAGVQEWACGALCTLMAKDGATCAWHALPVERLSVLVLTVSRA